MSDSPAFIFDLGKVLVDFDYSIAARKITARSTRAPWDMHGFLGSSPLLVEYETGSITRLEMFEAVCAATGFQGTLEEFSGYFAAIFFEIPEMIALHGELRQRGFRTYIFSNTNDLAVEHIRREFPFFSNFDGYIYSYEVGVMKPHSGIYEAMERLCGRHGADLIYLDDRLENVEAGQRRGWRSIHHQTPRQTRAALAKTGVLPA